MSDRSFDRTLFAFLRELKANNDRGWFAANKDRYERDVKEPALAFIGEFAAPLRKISKHFVADPRPTGGSMFRIYRDIRFSKDKSPYKTHAGLHFRHTLGRDAHAPGFYLHLEPGGSGAAAGIWHPDGAALAQIRDAIDQNQAGWRRALRDRRAWGRPLELKGASLKRPPRGFAADHPMIDDLKRKDFYVWVPLNQKQVTGSEFVDDYARFCRAASPFLRFLSRAIDVPF